MIFHIRRRPARHQKLFKKTKGQGSKDLAQVIYTEYHHKEARNRNKKQIPGPEAQPLEGPDLPIEPAAAHRLIDPLGPIQAAQE